MGRLNIKCVGQVHDIEQTNIALAAFDPANIVSVKVRQLRQPLLREAAFRSQFSDTPTE
jgi:hypothetical protein